MTVEELERLVKFIAGSIKIVSIEGTVAPKQVTRTLLQIFEEREASNAPQ